MTAPRIDTRSPGRGRSASRAGKWPAAALLAAMLVSLPSLCLGECELSGPQKIVIDATHDRLLVSNDHTGDITQINSAGAESCFVPAAGFIDGMEIAGNTVYGACSGRKIKGYDLDSRLLTVTVTFPGPGYLSSLVADDSGYLYVSCPLRNEIYKIRLSDHAFWTFVTGSALNKPNGMIFQAAQNRLVVIEDRANPRIMAVSLADSSVTTLATTTLGGGDGIAQDLAGRYYVTGYYLPGVYRFDPSLSGSPTMIFEGGGIVYPTYDVRDNTLLVTCYDSSNWVRIPLETEDVAPAGRIKACLLGESRPNPFFRQTDIRFELAVSARTRLDVYGVQGELVRNLVDEARSPGAYSVAWDGSDGSGRPVACGTYHLRLVANGVEQSRKVLRVR